MYFGWSHFRYCSNIYKSAARYIDNLHNIILPIIISVVFQKVIYTRRDRRSENSRLAAVVGVEPPQYGDLTISLKSNATTNSEFIQWKCFKFGDNNTPNWTDLQTWSINLQRVERIGERGAFAGIRIRDNFVEQSSGNRWWAVVDSSVFNWIASHRILKSGNRSRCWSAGERQCQSVSDRVSPPKMGSNFGHKSVCPKYKRHTWSEWMTLR